MEIRIRDLEPAEAAVVAEATERLDGHPRRGDVAVVAGALLADGSHAFSVDVRSRKSWTCAEPGLVARVLTEDLADIRFVVAVARDDEAGGAIGVISPCGSCREMLHRWAPDGWVAVARGGAVRAAGIADLFPFAGMFAD